MTACAFALLLAAQDVGPARKEQDATVRTLTLSKPGAVERWRPRVMVFPGAAVLACGPGGQLRKLSYPGLRVESDARLPFVPDAFSLSRAGLVALSSGSSRARIYDPSTLAEVRSIEVKETRVLVSAASLDHAFVTAHYNSLATLHLGSGQIVRKHEGDKIKQESFRRVKKPDDYEYSMPFGNPRHMKCSPDGKYLLIADDFALHRFAVSGYDLLHEEVLPLVASFSLSFDVSSDSRYVTIPGQGHQPSLLLPIDDFQRKAASIPEEFPLTSMAVDPAGNRLIGFDGRTLTTFTMGGRQIASYKVPEARDALRGLFLHPSGKAVGIPLEEGFVWIEWEASPSVGTGAGPGAGPGAGDDDVHRLFLDAQLKVAREHFRAGRLQPAREALEDIIKSSPASPQGKDAKILLDLMKESGLK